ncbi:uncharacterized protein BDW43DRAFT_261417 [Aspergillus alliaceus]|uniref:uncharacterized protein n=1 Tax=Petromyces alliaceus TaxID=209559 RepID=UPI0012A40956|nr:uncharacterized protein BDW43DRAFT_261417 [Aspergillus alliaceus]KAB8238347.1 hypothetical protein BDW43DRAFT_261417 [Aspergillus alliaceus]
MSGALSPPDEAIVRYIRFTLPESDGSAGFIGVSEVGLNWTTSTRHQEEKTTAVYHLLTLLVGNQTNPIIDGLSFPFSHRTFLGRVFYSHFFALQARMFVDFHRIGYREAQCQIVQSISGISVTTDREAHMGPGTGYQLLWSQATPGIGPFES